MLWVCLVYEGVHRSHSNGVTQYTGLQGVREGDCQAGSAGGFAWHNRPGGPRD